MKIEDIKKARADSKSGGKIQMTLEEMTFWKDAIEIHRYCVDHRGYCEWHWYRVYLH